MRDMLGLLKIRYRDISYVIKLFSKYTVITGFSGTGKSELVRLVEDAIVERVQSKIRRLSAYRSYQIYHSML